MRNTNRLARCWVFMLIAFSVLIPYPQRALGQAYTYTTLHSFGSGTDGYEPETTLNEVTPGVFVGTSDSVIFQVDRAANFKNLLTFDADTLGYLTSGQLLQASNGFFYGGNDSGTGYITTGSLFIASLTGNSKVLKGNTYYASSLIEASDGNLYGVAAPAPGENFAIFRMSQAGAISVLHSLGPDNLGAGPLLQASNGDLYGTTTGLIGSTGTIFRISLNGEYTLLYTFESGFGGVGGLIEAPDGLLYGSARNNAPLCPADDGYIFGLTLSGTLRKLYAFESCYGTGYGPSAGLVQADDGKLYGVTDTAFGGGPGTIFRVGVDGSGFSSLWSFDAPEGFNPGSAGPAFIQASDGVFYGTTSGGGLYGFGTVYSFGIGLPPPTPNVGYLRPQSGSPGTTVIIGGAHLIGLSGVSFNGVPATTFSSRGSNFVTAVVPQGATSGPVTVTTMNGSKTSKAVFTIE